MSCNVTADTSELNENRLQLKEIRAEALNIYQKILQAEDSAYKHKRFLTFINQWFDRRQFDGLHFGVTNPDEFFEQVRNNEVSADKAESDKLLKQAGEFNLQNSNVLSECSKSAVSNPISNEIALAQTQFNRHDAKSSLWQTWKTYSVKISELDFNAKSNEDQKSEITISDNKLVHLDGTEFIFADGSVITKCSESYRLPLAKHHNYFIVNSHHHYLIYVNNLTKLTYSVKLPRQPVDSLISYDGLSVFIAFGSRTGTLLYSNVCSQLKNILNLGELELDYSDIKCFRYIQLNNVQILALFNESRDICFQYYDSVNNKMTAIWQRRATLPESQSMEIPEDLDLYCVFSDRENYLRLLKQNISKSTEIVGELAKIVLAPESSENFYSLKWNKQLLSAMNIKLIDVLRLIADTSISNNLIKTAINDGLSLISILDEEPIFNPLEIEEKIQVFANVLIEYIQTGTNKHIVLLSKLVIHLLDLALKRFIREDKF